MDATTIARLKRRFRTWSGGFSPESDYQITVYIDYAIDATYDPVEARKVLLSWLCAEDPDEDIREVPQGVSEPQAQGNA